LIAGANSKDDHLEWYGLVESKIRLLVGSLERNPHIQVAHVNPECYPGLETNPDKPTSLWFIGLLFDKDKNLNVDLTYDIQNFTDNVHRQAVTIKRYKEGMRIEAKHVKRKQLISYLPASILNRHKKKDNNDSRSSTPTNTPNRLEGSGSPGSPVNSVPRPSSANGSSNSFPCEMGSRKRVSDTESLLNAKKVRTEVSEDVNSECSAGGTESSKVPFLDGENADEAVGEMQSTPAEEKSTSVVAPLIITSDSSMSPFHDDSRDSLAKIETAEPLADGVAKSINYASSNIINSKAALSEPHRIPASMDKKISRLPTGELPDISNPEPTPVNVVKNSIRLRLK